MDNRELELSWLQDEIKDLEILNQAYGRALEREKAECSKLLTAKEKDKAKLKEKRKLIKLIGINLKARAEKIENLKLEEKWLKRCIKRSRGRAWDILDKKGIKPKEFFVDSKYI